MAFQIPWVFRRNAKNVAEFTLTERPTALFAEVTNSDPLTLNAHGMFPMTEEQVTFLNAEMQAMPQLCALTLQNQDEEKAGTKRKHFDLVESQNKKMRELTEE